MRGVAAAWTGRALECLARLGNRQRFGREWRRAAAVCPLKRGASLSEREKIFCANLFVAYEASRLVAKSMIAAGAPRHDRQRRLGRGGFMFESKAIRPFSIR
jgi:hypothetical protein